jgi:hypothetical protein
MSGKQFENTPDSPIVARVSLDAETVLAEMWQSPVALMSKRLHQALLCAGVANLDVYPAEIQDEKTGEFYRDYVAFNIVGRVAAEHLTRHDDVLVSDIDLSSLSDNGLLMFRLDQAVNTIVVHDTVRRAIEDAGIDTLTFFEPSEWTG